MMYTSSLFKCFILVDSSIVVWCMKTGLKGKSLRYCSILLKTFLLFIILLSWLKLGFWVANLPFNYFFILSNIWCCHWICVDWKVHVWIRFHRLIFFLFWREHGASLVSVDTSHKRAIRVSSPTWPRGTTCIGEVVIVRCFGTVIWICDHSRISCAEEWTSTCVSSITTWASFWMTSLPVFFIFELLKEWLSIAMYIRHDVFWPIRMLLLVRITWT